MVDWPREGHAAIVRLEEASYWHRCRDAGPCQSASGCWCRRLCGRPHGPAVRPAEGVRQHPDDRDDHEQLNEGKPSDVLKTASCWRKPFVKPGFRFNRLCNRRLPRSKTFVCHHDLTRYSSRFGRNHPPRLEGRRISPPSPTFHFVPRHTFKEIYYRRERCVNRASYTLDGAKTRVQNAPATETVARLSRPP
jgi:hypothetical protein